MDSNVNDTVTVSGHLQGDLRKQLD